MTTFMLNRASGDRLIKAVSWASDSRLQTLRAVLRGRNTVAALDTDTSDWRYHHLKEPTATGRLASERRAVYEVPAARIVPVMVILVAAGTPG